MLTPESTFAPDALRRIRIKSAFGAGSSISICPRTGRSRRYSLYAEPSESRQLSLSRIPEMSPTGSIRVLGHVCPYSDETPRIRITARRISRNKPGRTRNVTRGHLHDTLSFGAL